MKRASQRREEAVRSEPEAHTPAVVVTHDRQPMLWHLLSPVLLSLTVALNSPPIHFPLVLLEPNIFFAGFMSRSGAEILEFVLATAGTVK